MDASSHFIADFIQSRMGTDFGEKPALVGYDLVSENRRRLENGMIDFLLTQRPEEQGYNGVNRLFRMILLDESCPESEYTPIDIITQENLRYINEEEE